MVSIQDPLDFNEIAPNPNTGCVRCKKYYHDYIPDNDDHRHHYRGDRNA